MAQVEKPTNKLYAACAQAMCGTVGDFFKAICMDTGSMAAFSESTNAPATECTVSGLTRTAITPTKATVSVANDQIVGSLASTAGGAATVNGFLVMSNSTVGQGNALMWCAYNAAQALETSDVITNTGKVQFKLGS